LNKVIEERTEGLEEEQGDAEKSQEQHQQQHLSLSTQAYKLFSERKTPLQVAMH
jgi:hypothetical protein